MKTKPLYWKSLTTGNEYDYYEYLNHGYGGIHNNRKDLPKDEYPYTIIYAPETKPLWQK